MLYYHIIDLIVTLFVNNKRNYKHSLVFVLLVPFVPGTGESEENDVDCH